MVKKLIWIISAISFVTSIWVATLEPNSNVMPEICDNGIDDDMDGDIDLNDDDCTCLTEQASSLIPNPSFEERSCCPSGYAQLFCANNWVQASEPTTDYVNTCDFLGDIAQVPLPIPDGSGAIGFRNGRPSQNQPNFKEYTGAVLTSPMVSGIEYKLELFVGFASPSRSPSLEMAIFGSTNPNALPFGNGQQQFGCPTNGPGWDQLGLDTISGTNEWVLAQLKFTPTKEYTTFVVGPSCSTDNYSQINAHYYFFDNLILAEVGEFDFDVPEVSGHHCQDNLVLGVEPEALFTYQWFLEGVALNGEINSFYNVPAGIAGIGNYQLVITDDIGCRTSRPYQVTIEEFMTFDTVHVCQFDSIQINGDWINEAQEIMVDTLNQDGCDSISLINVEFEILDTVYINTTICENTYYVFGTDSIRQAGEYTLLTTSIYGCDSLVYLSLDVEPPLYVLGFPDTITVNLGDIARIDPNIDFNRVNQYEWNDGTTELCIDCEILSFIPLENGIVYFVSIDTNGCEIVRSTTIVLDKKYEVFIPNIFTPNEDGINDQLKVFTGNSATNIDFFKLFDRWGNLIFEDKNITLSERNLEWDGFLNNDPIPNGVYTYTTRITFLDGHVRPLAGNITVLR